MAKAEASVEELVGMIERGELRLPEMQRRYVWRSTQVRDLLDSLYRGYPSGAILLWETDEDVPQQKFAVSQELNPYKTTRLLLDGQQRLTSLSAVIRGEPVKVYARTKPIELLFNLDHPEVQIDESEIESDTEDDEENEENIADENADASDNELQKIFEKKAFVVNSKKLEQSPHWVKVSEVFRTDEDAPFLQRAGIKEFNDPNYSKYSKRLARVRSIRKYIYRMDVLERALSYDEVTQIFVRVNSLGTKLRSSDLALAQITAKWRGALVQFQNFQEKCAVSGFNLDMGLHLKNLISFCTGQSRFLTVSSQSSDKLKSAWSDAIAGMEFAINFFKSNLGIESPALLASPYLLIMVGFHGHRRNFEIDPSESKLLRQWALLANAKGRYSRGSSETLLDQDLAVIRDGKGASELIERLKSQVGRLDIAPEELDGRNQKSALFKTMFIAFKQNGAKDWNSNLAISLDHNGSIHKLQFHHIFPKATLKGKFSSRESDDIANLAFIGGRTNRKISDKLPRDYLPSLIEKQLEQLELQCIPTDEQLMELGVYKDFLNSRRKAIAERLNEFLGVSTV